MLGHRLTGRRRAVLDRAGWSLLLLVEDAFWVCSGRPRSVCGAV